MRTRLPVLATATPMLLGLTIAMGTAALATPASAATPPTAPLATGPCGTVASPPDYTHVVWIWMENESYNSVIGSTQAPYINSVAAECGLATNYHNITHKSLPNYLGATSGLGYTALHPFDGDCNPGPNCQTAAKNIFGQGETWKAYEESMPAACDKANSGNYLVHHNPPPYYSTLTTCPTHDVAYSQFATDLSHNSLPAFSFITPNRVDDMHSGSIRAGDSWLAKNLTKILASPEYHSGSTVVFITWDEGEGGHKTVGEHCAANTTDVSCHVATLVISPSTQPGTRSTTLFSHYSLLATAEQLLGLPRLGSASSAASMTAAFHLRPPTRPEGGFRDRRGTGDKQGA
ncbi:MAG TPA: alkaline phosphatase family protein [Streptosporangiaceae bacterium]|nr:alkaline phosphatase family protein [Streptosporangiaceae bacterium]